MAAFRFFIPDVEYLKDPEGLVGYVEEKVKLGNICLYCNGKGKTFHTYRALQQVRAQNADACFLFKNRLFSFEEHIEHTVTNNGVPEAYLKRNRLPFSTVPARKKIEVDARDAALSRFLRLNSDVPL